MTGLRFSNEAANQLEALYMTADIVAQRSETLRQLGLARGQSVIDLGSGPGFLCESMAEIVGSSGRVVGIDISADLVERCARRNRRAWLSYRVCDATRVDEPDAAFDVATCTQVAEYVAEVDKAIAEAFRLLKPGGRALFIATDWDAVIWHSDAPERMAEVLAAWEAHCAHPRLPRSMARRLADAGFTVDEASVFPILNRRWDDDAYSKGIARTIGEFVAKRGGMSGDDVAAWAAEFPRMSREGRYFFFSARFIFLASKLR